MKSFPENCKKPNKKLLIWSSFLILVCWRKKNSYFFIYSTLSLSVLTGCKHKLFSKYSLSWSRGIGAKPWERPGQRWGLWVNPLGFKLERRKDGAIRPLARVSWVWQRRTPAGLTALTQSILPEPGYRLDKLASFSTVFLFLKSHALVPAMSASY